MNNRLVIIGAGNLGEQVLHFAKLQGKYEVVGFIDDTKEKGELFQDLPILGGLECLDDSDTINKIDFLFIAIGYNHFNAREVIFNKIHNLGIPLATIIAPYTFIDPTAEIGEGCIVCPGAIIDYKAIIGNNVFIGHSSVIGHNSKIGSHSFLAGKASNAGFCIIGERCFIGFNSAIIDNISIHDDVVVGAGSIIRTNIESKGTFVNDKLFKNAYLTSRD